MLRGPRARRAVISSQAALPFRSALSHGAGAVCPRGCALILLCLGQHSCGPLSRAELTLAADLRPYLERQACCSQGWLSAGHTRLGSCSGPLLCFESTGKHRINLFVNETGLRFLLFKFILAFSCISVELGKNLLWCWRCEMLEYGIGEARETQLKMCVCFFKFIWLHWVLVVTCRTLSCGVRDLVPWVWIEPRPPALGMQSKPLAHQGSPEIQPIKKQVCSGYGSSLLIPNCLTHQVVLLTPGQCVLGKKM